MRFLFSFLVIWTVWKLTWINSLPTNYDNNQQMDDWIMYFFNALPLHKCVHVRKSISDQSVLMKRSATTSANQFSGSDTIIDKKFTNDSLDFDLPPNKTDLSKLSGQDPLNEGESSADEEPNPFNRKLLSIEDDETDQNASEVKDNSYKETFVTKNLLTISPEVPKIWNPFRETSKNFRTFSCICTEDTTDESFEKDSACAKLCDNAADTKQDETLYCVSVQRNVGPFPESHNSSFHLEFENMVCHSTEKFNYDIQGENVTHWLQILMFYISLCLFANACIILYLLFFVCNKKEKIGIPLAYSRPKRIRINARLANALVD